MMSTLTVYLWTRLDTIGAVLAIVVLLLLCGFMTATFLSIWGVDEEEEHEAARVLKIVFSMNYLASFAFAVIGFILIPTQKDAALIYILPKAATHTSVQEWEKTFDAMPKAVRMLIEEYTQPKKKD